MQNKIKGKFNHIDELIEITIEQVRLGEMLNAAKGLMNLAKSFSETGMGMKSFLDIRLYVIEQAKKESNIKSINEKLNNAEKQLRRKRNDRSESESTNRQAAH